MRIIMIKYTEFLMGVMERPRTMCPITNFSENSGPIEESSLVTQCPGADTSLLFLH